MSHHHPIVGISGFHQDVLEDSGGPYRALVCETAYFDAFVAAGAAPIVLSGHVSLAKAFVAHADAIVLTGGPDIEPTLYGQASAAATDANDPSRDEFELALVREALATGTPILGICRGMQLLNVALGGTLHQHVPDHLRIDVAAEAIQTITIAPASRLHAVLGADMLRVNSLHHQAADSVGAGLVVSAVADDGTIEGLEHESAAMLGVQWHPEKLTDEFTYRALVSWLMREVTAVSAI